MLPCQIVDAIAGDKVLRFEVHVEEMSKGIDYFLTSLERRELLHGQALTEGLKRRRGPIPVGSVALHRRPQAFIVGGRGSRSGLAGLLAKVANGNFLDISRAPGGECRRRRR